MAQAVADHDLATPETADLDAYRCTGIGEGMDAPDHSPLAKAFANLRALGFVTDEGDSCCSGCMGGNVEETAYRLLKAGKPVNGYVGYYIQEKGDLDYKRFRGLVLTGKYIDNPCRTYTNDVTINLLYGTPEFKNYDFDLSTKEVGEIVCSVLDDHSIHHNWSGTARDRITL